MDQLKHVMAVIEARAGELKKPGVVSIRPGYKLRNGWPTKEPAAVVIVSQGAGPVTLPAEIDGIPVDVRTATNIEELRFRNPAAFSKLAEQRAEFRGGAFPEVDPVAEGAGAAEMTDLGVQVTAAKPQIPYTPPRGVSLRPVTGIIPITCHASPDAGWPVLREYLAGTRSTLTVGMYDFTSKHILEEIEKALLNKRKFDITIDNPARNPTADQTDSQTLAALSDALGREFRSAWALVQSRKAIRRWIFPSAYHIKVAVRDSRAVWLSSGNWNNSNQPDMDPINHPAETDQATARKSDRDWHMIIEDSGLARQLEAFLQHDFDVAHTEAGGIQQEAELEAAVPETLRAAAHGQFHFHRPLRVASERLTITPLLTPDPGVYQPAMLKLLESAQNTLYIQLQYIHPSARQEDAKFTALLETVTAKIQAGLDVRIILSEAQVSQGWLERLQAAGVDLSAVRIQHGVHNKGFVVDSKIVVLGSQNWSAEGVLSNRDASVLVESATVAEYYQQIFLHDWERLARQRMQ